MNGVHDMGGMHGFGAVPVADDARFHARWERETYALMKLLGMHGQFTTHQMRATIESMGNAEYLASSYFERWLTGIETRLVEDGVVSAAALREAQAAAAAGETPPTGGDGSQADGDDSHVELVREAYRADALSRQPDADPRFEAGDAVRTVNRHPDGHTRLPGYARQSRGEVRKHLGTFHLPDAAATGDRSATEPVYSVGFDAAALWGDDADGPATVFVDLYESYLEPP